MKVLDTTKDKSQRQEFIKANQGNIIEFQNGCWLRLIEDNGIYWGVTPYGQDWACNADHEFLEKAMNWLNYWDENRTETGQLVIC